MSKIIIMDREVELEDIISDTQSKIQICCKQAEMAFEKLQDELEKLEKITHMYN